MYIESYIRGKINKMLVEEYQISEGEVDELISAVSALCSAINDADYFTMKAIRDFEREAQIVQDLQYKKDLAEREHQRKGVLGRMTSSPASVGSHVTSYKFDNMPRLFVEAGEKEEDLKFICQAHKINHIAVFQNVVPHITNGQKYADHFRAYQHGKSSSRLSMAMR